MSKHDHRVTLRQIEEYARHAQEICAGRSLTELLADWQATLALERALQVLGEAAKRLPDDLRERYPQKVNVSDLAVEGLGEVGTTAFVGF